MKRREGILEQFVRESDGDAIETPPLAPPSKADRFFEAALEWFGLLARLVFYLVAIAAIWFIWDTPNISDVPLAALTLKDIFRAGLKMAVLGLLVVLLFQPSQDPAIRQGWGGLGILAMVAGGIVIYFMAG